jgi:uncharacterized protein YdeI (YjbR/CyaY-like superfamily)
MMFEMDRRRSQGNPTVYTSALPLLGGTMLEEALDPRVDAYIEKAAPFAQPILTHLRELMHQACPHMTETMKWSMPFFVQGKIILAHMAAFKQHCAFGFWGSQMKKVLDKDGMPAIGGMGALGRLASLKDLPENKKLLSYMRQAAELVDSGERTKSFDHRKKKPAPRSMPVPVELAAALKKNKTAAKAFELFSTSHRNEYVMWIDEAKRLETKQKRLAQAIAWIAEGKSRHWKYQRER